MHREIQIKQFPIVTTHWWPKTRNERFVWENEQYLYSFYLLYTTMSKWSECAHIRCVCARSGSSASTLDGGRVWSVVLTQLCGIFLLEDAHCHRSCRFWTVYSRIMMTSFKQTRLLSSLYFYTSAPCIHFIHLYLGVNAWRRACLKRGALKNYLNCLTVLLYTVMCIPFGTKLWLFNFGMAQILFMGLLLRHSKIPFFFSSSCHVSINCSWICYFFTWLGGSDAGWGGWSCAWCLASYRWMKRIHGALV